jgi:hypothetical protein
MNDLSDVINSNSSRIHMRKCQLAKKEKLGGWHCSKNSIPFSADRLNMEGQITYNMKCF